jgi:hypothetical protein
MPAIIYQKTPGGLFATGERTVSTFPSGLVRVDQTFICPTSDAATHRADLAVGEDMPGGSAPAIDGLKIFPQPQERRRDDGFTEFIVSAYGRNTAGLVQFSNSTVIIDLKVYGYSYRKTTGTIALPINETYKFEDTGLSFSNYMPSNAFERYNGVDFNLYFTTVPTNKSITLVYADGSSSIIPLILHRINPINKVFWFSRPYLKKRGERNFGSFKEVDFETHSDITYGEFIAPTET